MILIAHLGQGIHALPAVWHVWGFVGVLTVSIGGKRRWLLLLMYGFATWVTLYLSFHCYLMLFLHPQAELRAHPDLLPIWILRASASVLLQAGIGGAIGFWYKNGRKQKNKQMNPCD